MSEPIQRADLESLSIDLAPDKPIKWQSFFFFFPELALEPDSDGNQLLY